MLVTVKVKTGAKKFEIAQKNGIIFISLTEPAENNKANIELAKELTKIYGSCRIVRGLKSRTKILEIPDEAGLEIAKRFMRQTKLLIV